MTAPPPDTPAAFFTLDPEHDAHLLPTAHARGPWDPSACHAGPPSAIAARCVERAVPDKQLARLTVEVTRPIPMAGFRTSTTVRRDGRAVSVASTTFTDDDGRTCLIAEGVLLATTDLGDVPTAPTEPLDPGRRQPIEFPVRALHDEYGFLQATETAFDVDDPGGFGPRRLWMRSHPILPDETPSAFQRLCPLADCGNGFTGNAPTSDYQFLNVDLTIQMHRAPTSEWLASDARSHWEPNGVGLSHATLHDEAGPIGVALQTLLIRRWG